MYTHTYMYHSYWCGKCQIFQEKERLLQAHLLKIGPIQVYEETSKPRRMKKFTHIKTSLEMAADQANKTPEKFFYHRSPMLDDQAPNEKVSKLFEFEYLKTTY